MVLTPSTWERPWGPMGPTVATMAQWLWDVDFPEVLPDPVGLLVGEQPSAAHNPKLPLWPYPASSAGGRLQHMSGMPMDEYLVRLARVNLARQPVTKWDKRLAADRLYAVLVGLPENARVVLCGARARDAYNLQTSAGIEWFEPSVNPLGWTVVAIPHPSGRCREYRLESAQASARAVLRWAAGIEGT